jgi:hypothetical protein
VLLDESLSCSVPAPLINVAEAEVLGDSVNVPVVVKSAPEAIETSRLLDNVSAATCRLPLLIVMLPVFKAAPAVKASVPGPVKVKPSAPVSVPLSVKVVPAAVTEMPLAAVKVKLRLVETDGPVYCSVPPARTRLDAAVLEAPMELLTPPLAKLAMLKTPLLIVVAPV